ncbi:MAG: hypothetical protein JXA98_08620 [Methanosarcinaceae archaeon]|nr:hypothetical protein [Methanosarcinaceae archaeon]
MNVIHDLFESESAVSSVIGTILIFGLAILSISTILLYSLPTLYEMEDAAQAQKVEQAFTVLDSRTSKVALGESPIQTTYVSLMGGSINVNGDEEGYNESKLVIITVDIGASWYSTFKEQRYRWRGWDDYVDQVGMSEFNVSMGTVMYSKDDRIIAYEGGGVWSKYPTGRAVMISPPEFHYNGETLTLPIMKINGNSSVSGTADVGITFSSNNMPSVLYPNTTLDINRTNPVVSDKIIIYIQSEFYDAWAEYVNTKTYASATVDDANKTAVIELEVTPPQGTSLLTDSFKVGALNQSSSEPIYNFSFDLEAAFTKGLNPSKYDIFASSGTKTLTYELQKKGGPDVLDLVVTYEDTAAGSDYIEHWTGIDVFPIFGSKTDAYSILDFLDDTFMMRYDPEGDGADPDYSWAPTSSISIPPDYVITDGNTTFSLNDLTQHYMKLLTSDESVVFYINGGAQDPVDYDESTITLIYDGTPGAITYMHITRNDLDAVVS